MKISFSLPLLAAVLVLALGGCDVTGPSDTVILNANSPIPPTVEYTFAYETNGNESIDVQSDGRDDLGAVLTQNGGFSRKNVVSARIDSVQLERLSSKTAPASQVVFDYLRGATVYLGSDATGKRIASASFNTTARSVSLSVENPNVTEVVRSGATPAFLQLDTATDTPEGRRDRVRVTVYFRLEVQGV